MSIRDYFRFDDYGSDPDPWKVGHVMDVPVMDIDTKKPFRLCIDPEDPANDFAEFELRDHEGRMASFNDDVMTRFFLYGSPVTIGTASAVGSFARSKLEAGDAVNVQYQVVRIDGH